jgi:hypothetical protein
LYIIDQFGGAVSKTFQFLNGFIHLIFIFLKQTPFGFANRISWGDAANYKNDENTLGAEVDVQLAYSGCQGLSRQM